MSINGKPPVELTCAGCGQAFVRPYKLRGAKYCGHSCAIKATRPGRFVTAESIRKNADARRGKGKSGGYIKRDGRHEHRGVAEKKLGRALLPGEVVHHDDENKRNNDPANIIALPSQSAHAKLHDFGRHRIPKTHCAKGHELTADNIRPYRPNERRCLICTRQYDSQWKRAQRRLQQERSR